MELPDLEQAVIRAALAAGLEHARGNPVVLMDGDLQHPPALLPQMVRAWADGAEVVEAVKVYHGHHPGRRRANLFYSLFAALSGHDLHAQLSKLRQVLVVEVGSHHSTPLVGASATQAAPSCCA